MTDQTKAAGTEQIGASRIELLVERGDTCEGVHILPLKEEKAWCELPYESRGVTR